jgi:hypothetical protein
VTTGRISTITGVLVMVSATSMCTGQSPEAKALAGATADVRATAERDRREIEQVLRSAAHNDQEQARTKSTTLLGPTKVFDSRVVQDGYEVDGVYYGRSNSGGGAAYTDVSVRMCVRFTALWPGDGTVKPSDVDCPASLPTVVPNYGTVTRTVKLTD